MAACRSSLENTENLIPVLNKTSPRAHTELELGVFGVHGKACEICSSLVQKKILKKNYFSSHKLPKLQSTSFWSQGILGIRKKKIEVILYATCLACITHTKQKQKTKKTKKTLNVCNFCFICWNYMKQSLKCKS
jgi:hypothetical protein